MTNQKIGLPERLEHGNWLDAPRRYEKLIFDKAGAVQKAADYLIGE